MTWYVVEGPDQTGKTRLCQALAAGGLRYERAIAGQGLSGLALRIALLSDASGVVWDRCHLSEIVHGPLDRGTAVEKPWLDIIEAMLLRRRARCVLLTERLGSPDGWENTQGRHDGLVDAFNIAAFQSGLEWERWTNNNGWWSNAEEVT